MTAAVCEEDRSSKIRDSRGAFLSPEAFTYIQIKTQRTLP